MGIFLALSNNLQFLARELSENLTAVFFLERDLACGHIKLLLVIILPESHAPAETFQTALGLPQCLHALAAVGGESLLPHEAPDVPGLEQHAQDRD